MTKPSPLEGPYSRKPGIDLDPAGWVLILGLGAICWLFIAVLVLLAYYVVSAVF